jgi:hypothetical protein
MEELKDGDILYKPFSPTFYRDTGVVVPFILSICLDRMLDYNEFNGVVAFFRHFYSKGGKYQFVTPSDVKFHGPSEKVWENIKSGQVERVYAFVGTRGHWSAVSLHLDVYEIFTDTLAPVSKINDLILLIQSPENAIHWEQAKTSINRNRDPRQRDLGFCWIDAVRTMECDVNTHADWGAYSTIEAYRLRLLYLLTAYTEVHGCSWIDKSAESFIAHHLHFSNSKCLGKG